MSIRNGFFSYNYFGRWNRNRIAKNIIIVFYLSPNSLSVELFETSENIIAVLCNNFQLNEKDMGSMEAEKFIRLFKMKGTRQHHIFLFEEK